MLGSYLMRFHSVSTTKDRSNFKDQRSHCTTNLVELEGTACDVYKTLLHTVEC